MAGTCLSSISSDCSRSPHCCWSSSSGGVQAEQVGGVEENITLKFSDLTSIKRILSNLIFIIINIF